ncbi:hypothetical protein SLEP1_g45381 [Rubroshorea leprosula]|uniref:Uncharacterized protein n=1 Tax=Rubroshorea leprosula TaxID=152421 RepID=A0AAV5LIY0_9ROSI|nr:hypothetical protein SLEP1_g45381 [Rubroshorea leprosula]
MKQVKRNRSIREGQRQAREKFEAIESQQTLLIMTNK